MNESARQTRGLFITGTDTGVGKTYLTALIARESTDSGVDVGVHKPVCSGMETGPDGERFWPDIAILSEAIGERCSAEQICPQRFEAPLAPPIAARLEGTTVDSGRLRSAARWWRGRVDLLLIEGVGGLLCPLTETETVADLAGDLGYPLLIVGRLGLGTINQTLLTVEAARSRGLAVAGIILNDLDGQTDDISRETNPSELAARCNVPILAVVTHHQQSPIERWSGTGLLPSQRPIRMNWRELAGTPGD